MGRVSGKVAIVTGAAQGLGRADAILLAQEGAQVAITDIKTEGGEAVAKEINEAGGEAIFIRQDVSQESEWPDVMAKVAERFGGLDIMVNNAGTQFSKNVEDTTLKEWRRINEINSESVFLGTKHAIEEMKKRGAGSIINMSSIYGTVGDDINAAYCATKAAILNFSKCAALHCAKARYKIRVNTVHPGAIRTPLVEAEMLDIARARGLSGPEEAEEEWNAVHPIGHIGEPIDIAYGVLYLASDESRFVTGSELVIDGGFTAQ